MYLMYLPPTTRKPLPRPQNACSWGGTRRAALRAPQGRCTNTFFCHWCSTRRPDFDRPLAPHASNAPEAPLLLCRSGLHSDPRASILSHTLSQLIPWVGVAPAALERPATTPQNPLPAVIGRCMYVYVSCIYHVCIMYVCVCNLLGVSADDVAEQDFSLMLFVI